MTTQQNKPFALHLREQRWHANSNSPGSNTVVFLHGLGDSADIWLPILKEWPGGREFEAVAFDLPGHGGSDWLEPDEYTATAMASAVTKVLLENEIDRPILIGHSLGARIALEIAADGEVAPLLTVLIDMSPDAVTGEPSDSQMSVADHIDTLITGANSADELINVVKDRLPLADLAALTEVIYAQIMAHPRPSSKRISVSLDPELKTLVTSALRADAWQLLGEAMSPVAIVRGEYSGVLDRATAERMTTEVIRCVANETIKLAGHAILLEQPQALAETLAKIVKQRLKVIS
ncbi:MAG: alpha/beta fold hydrolase [Granulosicoccus sp.]